MHLMCTCPLGHRWQSLSPAPVAVEQPVLLCPICRQLAQVFAEIAEPSEDHAPPPGRASASAVLWPTRGSADLDSAIQTGPPGSGRNPGDRQAAYAEQRRQASPSSPARRASAWLAVAL